jgi:hypothetical protein
MRLVAVGVGDAVHGGDVADGVVGVLFVC